MRSLTLPKSSIIEIMRGVFPNIRDDVAIVALEPKYMGKKEKARLRHYKVIDGGFLYEFDASLLTCLDDSQLLTIAKYVVNGEEITHAVYRVDGG